MAGGLPRLPRWLSASADAATSPGLPFSCPEQTIRQETCVVERIDGVAVLKCEELLERFRLCADGRREMVESSSATVVRPVGSEDGRLLPASGEAATRYGEAAIAMAPAVNETLGQMLDDFFAYAAELQQGLEQRGVDMSTVSAAPLWPTASSSTSSSSNSSSSTSGSGDGSGLFRWWQIRKRSSSGSSSVGDAAASCSPTGSGRVV